jgi:hypothetical protein
MDLKNNTKVRLQCPKCEHEMIFRTAPGIEYLPIQCPNCKSQVLYIYYKNLGPVNDSVVSQPRPEQKPEPKVDDRWQESNSKPQNNKELYQGGSGPYYNDDRQGDNNVNPASGSFDVPPITPPPFLQQEKTTFQIHNMAGVLRVQSTGQTYQLQFGDNVIGRRANSSKAQFQISTNNNKVSREHLVVSVRKDYNGSFMHYVRLYKQTVNNTYINNQLLSFGGERLLSAGDVISLPDGLNLVFEFPDEDETVIL